MCIWCSYFGDFLMKEKTPDPNTTFLIPKSAYEGKGESLSSLIDWSAVEYLGEDMRKLIPDRMIPRLTTGDGNCLLHAVSSAVWGVEIFHELLRKQLHDELTQNLEWYKKSSTERTEDEWQRAVVDAAKHGKYLEFIHIFAVANMIRRPIVLHASPADREFLGEGESGVAATFLPTRRKPEEIAGRPIHLAWNSTHKSHYIPLIGVEGTEPPVLPTLDLAFVAKEDAETVRANYFKPDGPLFVAPLVEVLNKKENRDKLTERLQPSEEQEQMMRLRVAMQQMEQEEMERRKALYNLLMLRMQGADAATASTKKSKLSSAALLSSLTGQDPRIVQIPDDGKKEFLGGRYDYLLEINLGGGRVSVLPYNIGDDPIEAVLVFLERSNLPADKLDRLVDFVKASVKPADLRAVTAIAEKEKIAKTAAAKSAEATAFTSALKLAGVHVPFSGPFISSSARAPTQAIVAKLVSSNAELLQSPDKGKLAVSPADLKLIERLAVALNAPGGQVLETDIVALGKLYKWPVNCIFPALDLVRMALLAPKGAEYFARSAMLISLVLTWGRVKMLALRIFLNMFSMEQLREQATKYKLWCLKAVSNACISDKPQVRVAMSQVLLNCSITLIGASAVAEKSALLGMAVKLLENEKDEELMYTVFVAIGNLVYCDQLMRKAANKTDLPAIVNLSLVQAKLEKVKNVSGELLQLLFVLSDST